MGQRRHWITLRNGSSGLVYSKLKTGREEENETTSSSTTAHNDGNTHSHSLILLVTFDPSLQISQQLDCNRQPCVEEQI